jgi:hypothetical protein
MALADRRFPVVLFNGAEKKFVARSLAHEAVQAATSGEVFIIALMWVCV